MPELRYPVCMQRQSGRDASGAIEHIIDRGIERSLIFTDADCK